MIPCRLSEPAATREEDLTPDRPTIRSMLFWLVTACVLPASLMAIALVVYNFQRGQAQVLSDSLGAARAMTAVVDRDVASAQAALFALSTSPFLSTNDLAAFYGQAKEALRDQAVANIVLIDAAGREKINTLKPFGAPLPTKGIPQPLLDIFATGQPAITDLFQGPVTGAPVVAVAVPVRRNGEVIYILGAGILPERLAVILERERLPSDWIGTIFDSAGVIVARTRDAARYVGHHGGADIVKRMAQAPEGSFERNTLEGIPVTAVYSRSAVSKWTVVIGIPRGLLSNALSRSLWSILAGTALLLAASLVLAAMISGRIASSVRKLVEPALALGDGRLVMAPSVHVKEVHEVGEALLIASKVLMTTQHLAMHDALTGLANRALFEEMVNQQLEMCRRTGANMAVLFIDLDGFKAVNDQHGHHVGDALLRAVSERLKAGIRMPDVVARFGGDEFAIVLAQTGAAAAARVAVKLVDRISNPYMIDSLTVEISASIGIAIYPNSGLDGETLLRRADEMMYTSKNQGKRRYSVAV